MSARFVSIRRKRSRAWSSRRLDRSPRRRPLYLASREASSLTGFSPKARGRDALEALERLGLERGVLRDVVHDHPEDPELRQGPPAAIAKIQRDEQDPREEAVAHPRRRQGLALGPSTSAARPQAVSCQRRVAMASSPSRSALPA